VRLSFPAGAPRTGVAIAAAFAFAAQCGALGAAPVAVALHLAATGLLYLLVLNLSQRRLGAPLIAAILFGVHPLAAAVLSARDGWREPAGAALGLVSGVLLARTPLAPRLLVPSLVAYAGGLLLAPATAAMPALVAAGVVGYHGLEPQKLLSKRHLPRFLAFGPLLLGGCLVLASHPGRGFGTAAADVLGLGWPVHEMPPLPRTAAVLAIVVVGIAGVLSLRVAPKAAWPFLALAAATLAAALLPDAWGRPATAYVALAFAAVLVAEGLETLFFRYGSAVAMSLTLAVAVALGTLSHAR
jgi:hypothetical protein